MTILKKDFFLKDSDIVAKELLGKKITSLINNKLTSGIIVEVESYGGYNDPASHGYRGITERNKIIFQEGGKIYVYLIYGKYYLLNIVTGKKNTPSSVFIRALQPLEGIDIMKKRRKINSIKNLTNGPAKLTIALGIDKSLNGKSIVYTQKQLFIEDIGYQNFEIISTTRIGISQGIELNKRFYIKDNKFVSIK